MRFLLVASIIFLTGCGAGYQANYQEPNNIPVRSEGDDPEYSTYGDYTINDVFLIGVMPEVDSFSGFNTAQITRHSYDEYSHRIIIEGENDEGFYMGAVNMKSLDTNPEVALVQGCSSDNSYSWTYDDRGAPSYFSVDYLEDNSLVVAFGIDDLRNNSEIYGSFVLEKVMEE